MYISKKNQMYAWETPLPTKLILDKNNNEEKQLLTLLHLQELKKNK